MSFFCSRTALDFKTQIGTYDRYEVPVLPTISIQHGEADLFQVVKDIFGVTKPNAAHAN